MAKTKYRPGDFLRIDDRSGFRTYASKTKQEWTGSIVNERLWESRQPQDFVKGVRDQQAVPQPRPMQLPEVFIGTDPSIFIYNDPNIGSSFIIEDATGPGPYYTPSFGHAFVEIIPGNGFENTDVTPPPVVPVAVGDPPVVTGATFTLVQPVAVDDPVGSIFATNVDDTAVWEIIAGDAGGNFQIVTDADGSGLLAVSHTNIPAADDYTLLLKVTNDDALFGIGVANVHVQAVIVPVVTGFSTSVTLGSITLGQLLGTITATNGPNAFAITNGNSLGYFAIDTTSGEITITTTTPVANTYILTVSAFNGMGTGFGTVTITVLPEPPPPPPPPDDGVLFTDESFVPILG